MEQVESPRVPAVENAAAAAAAACADVQQWVRQPPAGDRAGHYREAVPFPARRGRDVCDPGHAPGTGTPEPGGLTARQLLDAVLGVCYELPVAGVDLVEVSPPCDHAEITSYLANRVVLEALSGVARRRGDAAAGTRWDPLTMPDLSHSRQEAATVTSQPWRAVLVSGARRCGAGGCPR